MKIKFPVYHHSMKLPSIFRTGGRVAGLLAGVILWSGCQRDLNLVSQDSITDATFWKTGDDFKLAANNLYNGLDRFGEEDVESDIAFNVPNAVSNGSLQPSETSGQWNDSYSYIRSANNIIEKGAASTDPDIRRYVAEAKFFRAWYYWKILRLYGGVPLISKVLGTNDTALFTPRATRTATADFILQDLADAQADLPLQSDLSSPDIGR
ncbi:MAG TPA: RagB/SusD family nutrient uptake outer membrane protein, partial [Chitinophaga sp.]